MTAPHPSLQAALSPVSRRTTPPSAAHPAAPQAPGRLSARQETLLCLEVGLLRRQLAGSPRPSPTEAAALEARIDGLKWRLVLGWSALLDRWARTYARRSGLDPADLHQEALLAAHAAAGRYDPGRGQRFSTYMGWAVRGRLRDHCRKHTRHQHRLVSLDAPLGEDGGGLCHEHLTTPDADAPDQRAMLGRLFEEAGLTERQQHILVRRLGLDGAPPATLAEVGERWGLSPGRICQLQREALESLRQALNTFF